ncbi:hypothetical protein GO730_09095 [Spirosoma sp. HMF3257]|uniref:Uncharacterized protein n=1 Tax=Spirosoma telluris TaxID=2183553 RepID=A0A327NP05_9BACT|nr:hypothetical protein [Spirosoma telluris]RAI74398.1 hypothetical protein HMF3257_09005 [Spirosoma telluris]
MTHSLATLALVLLLAGTATAQEKSPRRSKKSSAGTVSATDATRSNPSAANTHDGTNGASTGAGTGLTNDQAQASQNPPNGPAKVDASSSVKTGASSVKGRKRSPKTNN